MHAHFVIIYGKFNREETFFEENPSLFPPPSSRRILFPNIFAPLKIIFRSPRDTLYTHTRTIGQRSCIKSKQVLPSEGNFRLKEKTRVEKYWHSALKKKKKKISSRNTEEWLNCYEKFEVKRQFWNSSFIKINISDIWKKLWSNYNNNNNNNLIKFQSPIFLLPRG